MEQIHFQLFLMILFLHESCIEFKSIELSCGKLQLKKQDMRLRFACCLCLCFGMIHLCVMLVLAFVNYVYMHLFVCGCFSVLISVMLNFTNLLWIVLPKFNCLMKLMMRKCVCAIWLA